jgi:hypothetical protein
MNTGESLARHGAPLATVECRQRRDSASIAVMTLRNIPYSGRPNCTQHVVN